MNEQNWKLSNQGNQAKNQNIRIHECLVWDRVTKIQVVMADQRSTLKLGQTQTNNLFSVYHLNHFLLQRTKTNLLVEEQKQAISALVQIHFEERVVWKHPQWLREEGDDN